MCYKITQTNRRADLAEGRLMGCGEQGQWHGASAGEFRLDCEINVASLAGHVPGSAGHTLYAASKAYLIKFSQSLALENRHRGVNVCALCPGFTRSEFHDVTGTRQLMNKMPGFMWQTAEAVVREGYEAAERGDVVRVTGGVNRFIKAMMKLLPDRLTLWLSARESKRYRDLGEIG